VDRDGVARRRSSRLDHDVLPRAKDGIPPAIAARISSGVRRKFDVGSRDYTRERRRGVKSPPSR